jgi:hypothetical protein
VVTVDRGGGAGASNQASRGGNRAVNQERGSCDPAGGGGDCGEAEDGAVYMAAISKGVGSAVMRIS